MTGPTGFAAETYHPDDIESSVRCSGEPGVCRGFSVCRHLRRQGSLRDVGTEGDPSGRHVPRLTMRPS